MGYTILVRKDSSSDTAFLLLFLLYLFGVSPIRESTEDLLLAFSFLILLNSLSISSSDSCPSFFKYFLL